MVENVNRIGEALGVAWSFFQNEAGELTVGACLLLAAIAFVTAYRSSRPIRPALSQELWQVVAVSAGVALVFGGVGLFFLVKALS